MLLRTYHVLVPFLWLFWTPLTPPPLWFWWFKFQREALLLLLSHPIHPHGRLFDWHHSFPKSPFKIVFSFHFFFLLQLLWPTCIWKKLRKLHFFFFFLFWENLKQIFCLQYSFNHAQGYQLFFLFLYFSNFFPKVVGYVIVIEISQKYNNNKKGKLLVVVGGHWLVLVLLLCCNEFHFICVPSPAPKNKNIKKKSLKKNLNKNKEE